MNEWTDVTLGDVLTLQRGFDLPSSRRTDGVYPIVSSAGITGTHDQYKAEAPGVVIGRYGSLGSVHWVNEPYWPHNTALWVKDFKGNDPRFISYLLRTVTADGSTASAVPGVNRNHLHLLPVRRPPFTIQRRIAAALAAFDELIEINERRIEVLEGLARSLYREWFVRFRFPGHENVDLVDSELGRIPEGWEVNPVSDVLTLRYGKSLPAKSRRPGTVPVISSAGRIDTHDEALVSGPGIVVGRKGNVGSVWWVDEPFFPIDTTYYVESDQPFGYLYWALQTLEFVDSHAAVPGLSREPTTELPMFVLPTHVNPQFARLTAALFESIAGSRRKTSALTEARDLLLPRLVTGQLDISEIDLGVLTPKEAA